MNLIAEAQDAADNYRCPWTDLPVELRQLLSSLAWRETPPLEPFNEWNYQRDCHVWQELIADMIREFRPNRPQSVAYFKAQAMFMEAIQNHALAWAEKHAEDTYDAEFDKESSDPNSEHLLADGRDRLEGVR